MTTKVQFQDKNGTWHTVQSLSQVTDAYLKRVLDQAEKTYKARIRAVDLYGNILDLRDVK